MVVLRSGLPSRPEDEHPQFVDAFNAYSPAGDVTAGLVYVNYGRWRAGWCMFPSVAPQAGGPGCAGELGGQFGGKDCHSQV